MLRVVFEQREADTRVLWDAVACLFLSHLARRTQAIGERGAVGWARRWARVRAASSNYDGDGGASLAECFQEDDHSDEAVTRRLQKWKEAAWSRVVEISA